MPPNVTLACVPFALILAMVFPVICTAGSIFTAVVTLIALVVPLALLVILFTVLVAPIILFVIEVTPPATNIPLKETLLPALLMAMPAILLFSTNVGTVTVAFTAIPLWVVGGVLLVGHCSTSQ